MIHVPASLTRKWTFQGKKNNQMKNIYTYLVNNVGLKRINNAHFSNQMISNN